MLEVCSLCIYMGKLDGLPALVEEHSTHERGVESRNSRNVQCVCMRVSERASE